jgi:hypothetical protein
MADDWSPKTFRTREEAAVWLPPARAILAEVQQRLPADQFGIHMNTLFIGTTVPEIVGCIAVSLSGFLRRLAPVEFPVNEDFEETVTWIVQGLLRWRERVEREIAENGKE